MKRLLTFLALCCLVVTGAWAQASASTQKAAAEEVINEFMGTGSGLTVNVTIDPNMKVNGKDKFTYTLSGSTLNITASNGVSACRGFYDFTKSNGAGICSWSANRFKAPASPTTTSKTVTSPYRDHQYLNVVTYGYSMPYWDENRWDKEIAWMALHGIDMPLMLVGSETIYRDVFKALYSTSDAELDVWEVGPAHLPWMRMGNLAGNSFDGPLGDHWHSKQKALAKHILKKMGELGMKPVVPAFGGFVPPAVAQRLGNASTTGWGWVPNNYKNYRLTPTAGTGGQDGEFKKIGKKFIELWDQEYESSYGSQFKYYLSDSFNEMDVPSDPTTLQTYGEQIYGAIKEGSGNNDAVWVTQGWEFVYGSGKWTNGSTSDAKYKALTAGVPQGKFMSLYMSPEYGNGKWSSYDNFDGDDWVYTMLPNMGGKNFWTGNLQNYATTWPKSMANSGAASNCTGWGMTMEGIEYNEMLYELIADMGWTEPSTGKDLNNWVLEYGNARYGSDKYSQKFKNLHTTMRNTVYTSYIDHANFGWQGNNKSGGYYNAGNIGTTNDTFFEGFEAFFGDENIGELRTIAEGSGLDETMRADLIEFSAFYAAARVEKICKRITTANNTGNKTLANELITELDKVMTDMDYILTGHPIYDEAKWEAKARALAGSDVDTQKKYVKNARRIVTTWYGNHQSHEAVNDYASRIYAGIIRDYYLPRLKAELNQLVNGTACNLRDIERTFTPNGDVATDAPELSTPGYYLGNDEKTLVAGGMTSSNTSDAVLLANIQALVEEAREAGEIIIEKNNLTVSTDAATHWYFVNSNNPSYTDRSLTATEVDGVKSTVKAQTTEATNEQIWRFVDNHDGTVRMENRNGQTLTWENGAAKTYIASINAGMTYELDEANTRYALIPEGIGANKALHMNNANGVPEAYGYKDAGTTNYYSGSTWTLSKADGYIGVPSDEDFARITRRFQGFQTSVWGTGSYGSVGQPKSAAALQAAIDAVATRDLALATYTDYLATYDTALKTNFNLPTDAEALKLFDLIISAFQIDPNINCNTEDQATFKAALQAAQTALAGNATGNTATTAATTLEAAVKAFITNAASFPYVSKAPANGQFDEGSKVITMKVKKSGYITTDAVDGSQNFKLNNSTAPTTKAGYWVVSGNDSQGYSFYNVGAGATKVLGMTGSEGNARAKLYDVSSTSGVTTKFFYKKNQNGDHCFYISGNNAWNDRDSYLALWNDAKAFGTDNGSAIVIATVENVELTPEEPAEGDWTASNWTACSTAQTTNFKASAYYDAKQITVGSAASTRRQVRAKAAEQGTNTVTVTIKFSSGTHAQALYGVQLLNEDGTVAYETSYEQFSLGTGATKAYTLNNVADGTYTVRIWSAATKGNETMTATGTVEVAINSTKDGETLNWNNTNWKIENTAVPAAVQALAPSVGITLNQGNGQTRTYYYMDKQMTFNKATTLTTTITNDDTTTALDLIGVELLKSGSLVQTEGTYDGHYSDGETDNTYTVQVPEAGNYTVRTWASYVPAKVPANGGANYVAGEPLAPYADLPLTSGVYEIQNSPTMNGGNRGYLVDYTSYTGGPSLAECHYSGCENKHPSAKNDGSTTSSKWYIHNDDGTYYIVSLSTLGSNTNPQFLSPATAYSNKATYSTTKVPVNIAQHSNNTVTADDKTYHSYLITGSVNSIYLCAACGTNSTSGAVTGANNADDGGSPWVFIPCDASTLTNAQKALRDKAIEIINAEIVTPDDDEPTVCTIDKTNGKLYKDGTTENQTWNNTWKSNNNELTFTTTANNMQWNGNNIDARSGSSQNSTYTLTATSASKRITGVTVTMKSLSANNQTWTINGTTYTINQTSQTITLTDISVQSLTMVNTGANNGTLLTNFNVTISDYDPYAELISESLTNAKWLQITNANNTSYAMATKSGDGSGSNLHTALCNAGDEGQLFALVGDNSKGFVIYNKALGSTYSLKTTGTGNGTAATWTTDTPQKWYLDDTYASAQSKPGYVITPNVSSNMGLNMYNGAGGDAKFYGAGDGGTHWLLSPVSSTPAVIHYVISGTKAHQDANNYVGLLKVVKGSYSSNDYITPGYNGRTENLYLPKGGQNVNVTNTKLHGWTCNITENNGEYTVTYTAEETDYQYLAFREDAQWNRIPAIATAKNGDLVAVYDYRVCHNDVGAGEVDQMGRYSTDNGLTWSEEKTIADGSAHGESGNVFGRAYGDPAIVADRESGKVAVFCVSGQTFYPNATASQHGMVAGFYSEDNGHTWQTPFDLTSQFWGSKGSMFQDEDTEAEAIANNSQFVYTGFIGSGGLVQSRKVKVGSYYRIYAAMLCRGRNIAGAYVIYSDDFGQNWHLLGGDNSVQAAPNSDEPKVEELPNGDVILSCRKTQGRYFNIWKWSALPTTGNATGTGAWGTVVDSKSCTGGINLSCSGNSCNGEILYVEATNATTGQPAKLMLQSIPAGDNRSNVEIWYKDITDASSYATSQAFASNWTKGLQVSTTSSAYSTMTVQQDGRIGFFYEEGPATYCMVYVPLTIAKITANAYNGVETPVDPTSVEVTYNIYLGDVKIGEEKVTETIGDAPTFTLTTPNYVTVAETLPEVISSSMTSFDLHTSYTNLPFTPDDKYYNIKITVPGSGTFWWNNEDGSAKELKAAPTSGNEGKAMWVIGGDWYNGFTIQSRVDGKYVASPAIDSNNVQANLVSTLSDLARFTLEHRDAGFSFKVKGGNTFLAHTSSSTLKLSMWNVATYNGNLVTFSEVGDVPAVLQEKIEEVFEHMYYEEVGYPDVNADDNQTAINALFDYLISEQVDETNYEAAVAAYDAVLALTEVVLPEAGHAYKLSLRSTDGSKHWYLKNDGSVSENEADAAIFVMGASGREDDFRAIFVTNNNDGIHYLKSNGATTATYAANYCDFQIAPMVGVSNNFITTNKAARFGSFVLKANLRHDKDASGPVNGVMILKEDNKAWDKSDAPYMNGTYTSAIEMTEVEYPYTAPTLVKNGDEPGAFASIWLPFPMIFPEGVEVYKGTQERGTDGNSYLGLERVDSDHAVAKGGYILYSESLAGEINVQPVAGTPAANHEDGDAAFYGTTEGYAWDTFLSEHTDATPYVLANKSKGIGFYRYTGTTFPKGKAIWMKPTGTDAECVKFGFDDVISAIGALHGHQSIEGLYDLQGHRLDKVQKGQVNVINGKKILIK